MIVLLDSGVLGLLVTPLVVTSEKEDTEIYRCTQWFRSLLLRGVWLISSDISDYEVRRELIRINSEGIELLDEFREENLIDFLPITSEVLIQAAEFWAETRKKGIPTSSDKNIDADLIISAQWKMLTKEHPGRAVYIATKNLKHLRIFVGDFALEWESIRA